MNQQIKKKLAAALVIPLFVTTVLSPSLCVTGCSQEEVASISEIAEQDTVIDEQALTLPTAGISAILTDTEVEQPTPTPEPETYTDGWVNVQSINVREEPNTDSTILDTYEYNTFVSKTDENNEWVKIKYEDGYAYINSEYISNTENEPLSPYQELIDSLTEDEKYLIYQITYLESGNQSMEGQRAVVEVILNRVLSDKFPNTVEGVLSQPGQFTTWKNRNSAAHNAEQEEALELVYKNAPVLTLDYLMFSRGQFSWGRNYIQIEDHWFGTF